MLPTNAKERKNIPLYSGLIKYFPDALAAVAEVSRVGNEQHNPGSELHWDRSKSTDELDALMRHLFQVGDIDEDGLLHSAKLVWRALANLQKEIEANEDAVQESAAEIWFKSDSDWLGSKRKELKFPTRYIAIFHCNKLGSISFGPFLTREDAQNYLNRNPDQWEGAQTIEVFNKPTEITHHARI